MRPRAAICGGAAEGRVATCCCYVVGAWGRRAGECASEGCGLQGRLVGAGNGGALRRRHRPGVRLALGSSVLFFSLLTDHET